MHHDADRPPKQCDECDQPAVWVRRTQFAGSHFFCELHAQAQEDFGQGDPSYFFWEELPSHDSEREDLERGAPMD